MNVNKINVPRTKSFYKIITVSYQLGTVTMVWKFNEIMNSFWLLYLIHKIKMR